MDKISHTHFMGPRHKFLIGNHEPGQLYKKAFLTPDEGAQSEYSHNTASWD